MAWTDDATDKQIGALYWMLDNHLPIDSKVDDRMAWLKLNKPTVKHMSNELGRVRELCGKYHGTVTNPDHIAEFFDSPIWKGFEEATKYIHVKHKMSGITGVLHIKNTKFGSRFEIKEPESGTILDSPDTLEGLFKYWKDDRAV